MKKLVAIFALFSMMVLTSFTSPNEVGGKNQGGLGKTISNSSTSCEIGGKGQLAG